MKRTFIHVFRLLLLATCSCDSSSSDSSATATMSATPIASAAPAASVSAAPSATASAIATAKPTSGAPSSLPFCKSADYGAEPLLALCAIGQDNTKAHFECTKKQPLPVQFCDDLAEWGCQYVATAGEHVPRISFAARFVRPGVAPKDGEIIDDNSLRSRFPRAGIVRGASVHQIVSGKDEGLKVVAAQTKKLVTAGCVVSAVEPSGGNRLECGTWQAHVWYIDASTTVTVDADSPKSPDCTK